MTLSQRSRFQRLFARNIGILILLVGSLLVILPSHTINAATLTVNTLSDFNTGVCGTTCSLRDAISVAASGDSINFQAGLTGTITLTNGELLINKNLTITRPGAHVL